MTDILDISRQARQDEKEKDRYKRNINDIKKLLLMPEFRRFVWRKLGESGVFTESFTGTSQTFYNEGKRSIGLAILNEVIDAKPEAFSQMQQEFISESKSQKEE